MAVATEIELTFYDAAHLACAIELGDTLVTEDGSFPELAADQIGVTDVGTIEDGI